MKRVSGKTAGWGQLGIKYHAALDSVTTLYDPEILLQMAADLECRYAPRVRGTTPGPLQDRKPTVWNEPLVELLRALANNKEARRELQRGSRVLSLNRAVSFHVYRAMRPEDSKSEAWRQVAKMWGKCGSHTIRGDVQKSKLKGRLVWDGEGRHDAEHLARELLSHAERVFYKAGESIEARADRAAKAVWYAFVERARVFRTARKSHGKN